MKILHLIYSEQVAGAEKYLLDLLPGLQQEGFECHLICVTPARDQFKFTALCTELNSRAVKTTLMQGTIKSFFSLAKQINKYLHQHSIHTLHAHLFKSDILAVLIKKFFNRKLFLISTKHGYQEAYLSNYNEHKGKIIYNLYYFIAKYLAANINEHITISKAMSDLYFKLKLTRDKIKYIHHGISIAQQEQIADNSKYRKGNPQLIIVGRVEAIKGHRYLFEAMPEIIENYPEVKLLVAGNGTQKEPLQNQMAALGITEKNIEFLGFQQDPGSFISNSDVIVLPSVFEPFGLVYIEAFALKVPVVAFDAPASNEIIAHNETGLLAPLFDSSQLAEKIIYLLQNPSEGKRLASNGYERYTAYFNTTRMIKETAAWYRTIIAD